MSAIVASNASASPLITNNMSTGSNDGGVIAGGVIAGLVLFAGAIWFLYYRERRQHRGRQTADLTSGSNSGKVGDYSEKDKSIHPDIQPALPVSGLSDSSIDKSLSPSPDTLATDPSSVSVPVSIPVPAPAAGLPARSVPSLTRAVSQHTLPDARPWPPASILRRPSRREPDARQPPDMRRNPSIRFQDPPPVSHPPRPLHLVGSPAESPASTPSLAPETVFDPPEVTALRPEIPILVDSPPGLGGGSLSLTAPLPAYSPVPAYASAPIRPVPAHLPANPKAYFTVTGSAAAPTHPYEAGPVPAHFDPSEPSGIPGQPPSSPRRSEYLRPNPSRVSLLLPGPYEEGAFQVVSNMFSDPPSPTLGGASSIHSPVPTSTRSPLPSASLRLSSPPTGPRTSSPTGDAMLRPPPPPTAFARMSQSSPAPSLRRSLSTATSRAARPGLPTSPRPMRSPSVSARSSTSQLDGVGSALLSRSASAHETRTLQQHRASGSGTSDGAPPMLWRYPTAHVRGT
ncbi:hypothetical protein K488DRAFT_86666 [Vararia minispora EC-137]|uniref:Uncharacterized protein n=1 Tax=Vararia minispora EC-137 TaxID=1314806 RepID=A0ACB8QJ28_9AGAM|nr:hypothetical protein K488DRAFT_86666 [Vararia minispora EC-137]